MLYLICSHLAFLAIYASGRQDQIPNKIHIKKNDTKALLDVITLAHFNSIMENNAITSLDSETIANKKTLIISLSNLYYPRSKAGLTMILDGRLSE